jgi:hypothetical protein
MVFFKMFILLLIQNWLSTDLFLHVTLAYFSLTCSRCRLTGWFKPLIAAIWHNEALQPRARILLTLSAPRSTCPIVSSSSDQGDGWGLIVSFIFETWFERNTFKYSIYFWLCVFSMLVDLRAFNSSHEASKALYLVISWQGAQFDDCRSYFWARHRLISHRSILLNL